MDHIKACIDRILPPELQAEAVRLAIEENPDNAREPNLPSALPIAPGMPHEMVVLVGKRWRPGRVLRVRFLDGIPAVQQKVEHYARQWERYANIRFDFVNEPDAEIRISFRHRGSWSYLGTDCLAVPREEPTMNFGWLRPETPEEEVARVVLHEFGHALGCGHEHLSPEAEIPWDRQAVYDYYMGSPNYWTREQVDRNLVHKYSHTVSRATQFDPRSIMLYPIPNEHTIGDWEIPWRNSSLSELDKQFIQQMYPRTGLDKGGREQTSLRPAALPEPHRTWGRPWSGYGPGSPEAEAAGRKVGDRERVNAMRVGADATGGWFKTKTSRDDSKFVPPDGYVVLDFSVRELRSKGDRRLRVGYEEAAEIRTRIEEQRTRLEADARAMLTEMYGEGHFESELNQVKSILESHTVRPVILVAEAYAKGHPKGEANNRSYVEAEIEAEIMYIGNNLQAIVDAVKAMKEGRPEAVGLPPHQIPQTQEVPHTWW